MKHIQLICLIFISCLSAQAQNEWTDGSSSPNNITDHMFRKGNVGIGSGFSSPPTTIPFVVDVNNEGAKGLLGGQILQGDLLGWYGPKNSSLEIQCTFDDGLSSLILSRGNHIDEHHFLNFWCSSSMNVIEANRGKTEMCLPIVFKLSNCAPHTQMPLIERVRITPGGHVGLNTPNPLANLHVVTDNGTAGDVLFEGWSAVNPNQLISPPLTGPGSRLMWIAEYGAFRAGYVSGAQWDNIGSMSFAIGENSSAYGLRSVAMGKACIANNENDFAGGEGSSAGGDNSFAYGFAASASGASFACGSSTNATGSSSFAANISTAASATGSFATGVSTRADGAGSSSFGSGTDANGSYSLAAGNGSITDGGNSSAFGFNTQAGSLDEFVIGSKNAITSGSTTTWVGTDPIFQIGNGDPSVVGNSNAMTVLKNGRVGIGVSAPTHLLQLSVDDAAKPGTSTWTIISDERLKSDVHDYDKGLSYLKQIRPVYFKYNKESGLPSEESFVGVIAQEIQKVLPATVKKSKIAKQDSEYLTFNSSELTYLLINSVKELANEVDLLKKENEALNSLVSNSKDNGFGVLSEGETSKAKALSASSDAKITEATPNPFTGSTVIRFSRKDADQAAVITITNGNGQVINSRVFKHADANEFTFDGTSLESGIYFCTLWINGAKADTRLLVLNH